MTTSYIKDHKERVFRQLIKTLDGAPGCPYIRIGKYRVLVRSSIGINATRKGLAIYPIATPNLGLVVRSTFANFWHMLACAVDQVERKEDLKPVSRVPINHAKLSEYLTWDWSQRVIDLSHKYNLTRERIRQIRRSLQKPKVKKGTKRVQLIKLKDWKPDFTKTVEELVAESRFTPASVRFAKRRHDLDLTITKDVVDGCNLNELCKKYPQFPRRLLEQKRRQFGVAKLRKNTPHWKNPGFWSTVDFSLKDSVNASKYGLTISCIASNRLKYAPETYRNKAMQSVAWQDVDWTQPYNQIAKKYKRSLRYVEGMASILRASGHSVPFRQAPYKTKAK